MRVRARRGRRPSRGTMPLPGTRWGRAQQRAHQQDIAPVLYAPGRYGVQSSRRGRWYEVVRNPTGGFSCSCPAGSFGQPCKHVAAVYLLGHRLAAPWQRESPWLASPLPVPAEDEPDEDP